MRDLEFILHILHHAMSAISNRLSEQRETGMQLCY